MPRTRLLEIYVDEANRFVCEPSIPAHEALRALLQAAALILPQLGPPAEPKKIIQAPPGMNLKKVPPR